MTKNNKKISVSPIIYNNGNRKLVIKINDREVLKMYLEEFKKLSNYNNMDLEIILASIKLKIDADKVLEDKLNLDYQAYLDYLLKVKDSKDPKDQEFYKISIENGLNLLNDDKGIYEALKNIIFYYKSSLELNIRIGATFIYMLEAYKDNKDLYNDLDKLFTFKNPVESGLKVDNEAHIFKRNIKEDTPLKARITYKFLNAIKTLQDELNQDNIKTLLDNKDTPFKSYFLKQTHNKSNKTKMIVFINTITNMINNINYYDSISINNYLSHYNNLVGKYKLYDLKLLDNDTEQMLKDIENTDFKDLNTYRDSFKDIDKSTPVKALDKVIDIANDMLNYDIDKFLDKYTTYTEEKTTLEDYYNNLSETEKRAFSNSLNSALGVALNDDTNQEQQQKDDKKIYQATSKQIKAIDNARGGLVTYTETDTQAIRNEIKEQEAIIKNTTIKSDKEKAKEKIKKLQEDLAKAEIKEKELKDEYNNVCDYLKEIIKSMANEPKTSNYYKDLKKRKREQEKRKKELERIIQFNGWQLDLWGNGNYELMINKRKKESLKLTIENLTKQIAKYTKEEQDIFDYLINKYLHNTDIKDIKFTLREYEDVKGRVRPSNNLTSDIQAIRLLFREVWTYYTTDNKTYTFNEEHLFTKLHIKGELVKDTTDLNNANLDTEISLEPTETLQKLLQDHDNYLYISTPREILQLNNDNEYLAKRLIKYLNYLARVNKKSIIEISLDSIIEELQHYGLKHFNQLDRHKTYKTEIVDVIDKCLSILEGDNHINVRFIEVLDRQPFINYDLEFRGKNQDTSINEWGKHKLKIKIFNLDDNKLIDTKTKQNKKKNKATKK